MEKTLVFVKPDGVERGLVGNIVHRFEKRDLKILSMKMITLSKKQSDAHYAEHVGKDFYPKLQKFITDGPIVLIVLKGENAIEVVRKMVGATNSSEAEPGTIRGDLAISKQMNLVHASDSEISAKREIDYFFPEIS